MDSRFIWIEGHYYINGRPVWTKRFKVSELDEKIRKPAKNYNCFRTIQQWQEPVKREREAHHCPFYFDLDGKLEDCQEDLQKIAQFFSDLNKEHFRVWFSGSKGYHIEIPPEALDIKPNPELTYIIRDAVLWLIKFLKLKTVDPRCYSIPRQWRLIDSIHQKSGLFKIELYPSEFQLPFDQLRELATKPRGTLWEPEDVNNVPEYPALAEWFQTFVADYQERKTLDKLTPIRNIQAKKGKYPDCIRFLLSQKTLPIPHTGNKAILNIATYLLAAGHTAKEAEGIIFNWAQHLTNIRTAGQPEKIRASVRSVVKTCFEHAYKFSCRFMHSLGSAELPIPCSHEACPYVSPTDQQPKSIPQVHLSEASKAEFKGLQLSTSAIVAGKASAPYYFPRKIRFICNSPEECQDDSCRLRQLNNELVIVFKASNPAILELINTTSHRQHAVVIREAGLKGCPYLKYQFQEWGNMEEILLTPVAEVEDLVHPSPHVVRRSYYVGHGLEPNRAYNLKLFSHPHPRSQQVIHVFAEVQSRKGAVDQFKMTPELKQELEVFQAKDEDVQTVFEKVHLDLARNLYHIYGRHWLAWTIDLVYHSVLSFRFLDELVQKGWAEALVVGDTGIGKSTIARKLVEHYRAGELISGETSSRTGITYTIPRLESGRYMVEWGAMPRNDRGLLIIDEFAALDFEEIAKMSDARSSGRLKVQGAARDETTARTRLIFLTNTRTGTAISSFDYGVLSVVGSSGIMDRLEDIRRLDLVQIASVEEVPTKIINVSKRKQIDHVYTSFRCSNLVLWAWSRKPEQIVWVDDAEEAVLDFANSQSKKYWPAIPIVQPSDQRFKIARLAVAAACRTFSTDDGERVIVTPDHVAFAVGHMENLYDSPSMGYDEWSEMQRLSGELNPELAKAFIKELKRIPQIAHLRLILLSSPVFRKSDLQEQLNVDKHVVDRIVRFLSKNNLIYSTSRGYRKRPHLIKLLRAMKFEEEEKRIAGYEEMEASLL